MTFSSPVDHSDELLDALENLPTPYFFDVTYYDNLQHHSLKEHIDRVGVVIYAQ